VKERLNLNIYQSQQDRPTHLFFRCIESTTRSLQIYLAGTERTHNCSALKDYIYTYILRSSRQQRCLSQEHSRRGATSRKRSRPPCLNEATRRSTHSHLVPYAIRFRPLWSSFPLRTCSHTMPQIFTQAAARRYQGMKTQLRASQARPRSHQTTRPPARHQAHPSQTTSQATSQDDKAYLQLKASLKFQHAQDPVYQAKRSHLAAAP